jgi:hypothetical protein
MAQLSQNRDLETDGYMDWSHIKKREDSFLASEWAKQVSALKLARAGFYYTGSADRVQCFSCRKTVENWCTGDQPVERHKEVMHGVWGWLTQRLGAIIIVIERKTYSSL